MNKTSCAVARSRYSGLKAAFVCVSGSGAIQFATLAACVLVLTLARADQTPTAAVPPSVLAQAPTEQAPTGQAPTGAPVTKPQSPQPTKDKRGFIDMGTVRLHPVQKVVEVDGWFNMDRGIVEFLACAPGVKSHETLISLDINPIELNLALLALGLKPGKPPTNEVDLRPIAGDRVVIFLKFKKKNDKGEMVEVTRRVEDCLINFLNEADMEHVGFVYTGSQFIPKLPESEFFDPNNPATERMLKENADKLQKGEVKKGDKTDDAKKSGTPVDVPVTGDKKPAQIPGKTPEKNTDKPGDATPKQAEKPEMIYAPLELGQFFALCHRPYAILDNPLGLPYPDPEYGANPDVLPRVTRQEDEIVPVTVIIRRPKKGEIDRTIKRMPFKMPEGYGKDDDGRDKTDKADDTGGEAEATGSGGGSGGGGR